MPIGVTGGGSSGGGIGLPVKSKSSAEDKAKKFGVEKSFAEKKSENDKKLANALARVDALSRVAPTAGRKLQSLVDQYGPDIPRDELKRVGLSEAFGKAPKRSFLDTVKHTSGSAILGALDILDRPRNAVATAGLSGARALHGEHKGFLGVLGAQAGGFVRGLTGKEHNTGTDVVQSVTGSKPKGVSGFLAGLGVDIVTDPTTFLTAGTAGAAKSGLKETTEVLGKDAAERVALAGTTKVLKSQERKQLRDALVQRAESAGAKNAEKAADKTLKVMDKQAGGGLKIAGRTVVPESQLGDLTSKAVNFKPVGRTIEAVAHSRPAERLADALVPRAELRREMGSRVADTFERVQREAGSTAAKQTDDLVHELRQAAKAAKVSKDDIENILLPALDQGGDVGMTAMQLAASGRQDLATLLHKLDLTREDITQRQIAAGLLDPARARDEYVMRALTPEGTKRLGTTKATQALKAGPNPSLTSDVVQNAAQADLFQGGHLLARTLHPDKSIQDVEAILSGKIGATKPLYEHNVLQLSAARANAANHAIAQAEAIKKLASEVDDAGNPLAFILPTGTKPPGAVAHLYERVSTGLPMGDVWVPTPLKNEMLKVQRTVTNDATIKAFDNTLNKLMTLWKGYVTVTSPSFHLRNAIGNVWNNALAGITNPRVYVHANRLQAAARAARSDPEAARIGIEGVLRKTLSPSDYKLYENARRLGVIEEGFFAADLGAGHSAAPLHRVVEGRSRLSRLGDAINPTSVENTAIRKGRAVGAAIENNARLAHFIGQIDKGMSADDAALSVKKYLFDYGDLTPFEQSRLKAVIPFYTFMRKNTPLQMASILRRPGQFTAAAHAYFNAAEQAPGGTLLPQYAVQAGQIPFSIAGRKVGIGLDLPLNNAADTIALGTGVASNIPGVRALVPKAARMSPSEAARNALQPVGGPIGGILKGVVEEATGRDLLTGGKARNSFTRTLVDNLLPIINKAEANPLVKRDVESLVRQLTGLNATQVTTRRENAEVRRRLEEVQGTIDRLRAQGIDVPGIPELAKKGLIPKQPRKGGKSPGGIGILR